MASIVNKVKETLLGHDDNSKTTTHQNTTSTHNAPADPHRGTTQHAIGGTGTTGYDKSTDPHHKSNITSHDGSHTLGASGTAHTGTSTGLAGAGTNKSTAGPHSSNVANKLDPRVDSDRDGSTALGAHTTGHAGAHPTGTHTSGHTGTHHPTGHTGAYNTTTSGPHSSNVGNKLDPRVDSDRDGSTAFGSHTTGTHPIGTHTVGHTGTHHITGHTGAYNTTTSGPHSSNVGNKLDPRVDSDRDGSTALGAHTTGHAGAHPTGTHTSGHTGTHHPGTHTSGHTGTHHPGTHTSGHTGTHHPTRHTGAYNTTTSGPHSSNVVNKLDPRVDSDRDGSTALGGTGTHTGIHGASGYDSAKPHPIGVTSHGTHTPALNSVTGTGATTGSHVLGTHSSGSHVSGSHSHGAGDHHHTENLPGPAPNTAGPHKSDIMNKLDPRVDSDLDGSKTIGGNKTYQSDL